MAQRWKIVYVPTDEEFECDARNRLEAIEAAKTAGFMQKNANDQYPPLTNYRITPIAEE